MIEVLSWLEILDIDDYKYIVLDKRVAFRLRKYINFERDLKRDWFWVCLELWTWEKVMIIIIINNDYLDV
jgi:hypothetical protein